MAHSAPPPLFLQPHHKSKTKSPPEFCFIYLLVSKEEIIVLVIQHICLVHQNIVTFEPMMKFSKLLVFAMSLSCETLSIFLH